MVLQRIPFHQLAMATIVGVAGGLYVYRPIFETPKAKLDPLSQNKDVGGKKDMDVNN